MKYTATSMADLADMFQARAAEYRRAAEAASTKATRNEWDVMASAFAECATIVRNTTIETPSDDTEE